MSIDCSRKLQDKIAIVTASTAGIGLAIAESLLHQGAKVLISSRRQSSVDTALQYLGTRILPSSNVRGIQCHVGKEEDIRRLIQTALEEFDTDSIDIVVSNAAVNPAAGPILETDDGVIDKILDINVKSAIQLVKYAKPYFKKRGSSVVFISSYTAFNPAPPIGMYAVSKTALLGLTKALAEELGYADGGEMSVRVNCVCPGIVPTKFAEALVATEEMQDYFKEKTMLKELGTPEKIASVVAFLASDDAAYMTGEVLVVAGGMQSRL